MNSEREIEARQYRAEGQEEAFEVRAKADREAVVIEANAYKESEQLRGDGDAKSAAIYASAFNQDPSFISFIEASMPIQKYSRIKGTCWYLIQKRVFQILGSRKRQIIDLVVRGFIILVNENKALPPRWH